MTGISIFGASGRMGQAITEALELRDDVRISEHRPDVYVDFSAPSAGAASRRGTFGAAADPDRHHGLAPAHHALIGEAAARNRRRLRRPHFARRQPPCASRA